MEKTGNTPKEKLPEVSFEHFDDFHTVALRILLIDDKVGTVSEARDGVAEYPLLTSLLNLLNSLKRRLSSLFMCSELEEDKGKGIDSETSVSQEIVSNDEDSGYPCKKIKFVTLNEIQKTGLLINRCDDNSHCEENQCKLCTIKRLMDNGKNGTTDNNDGKALIFKGIGDDKDYFYWEENEIECYHCTTVIEDFIDDDSIDFQGYNEIILKDENSQKEDHKNSDTEERPFEIQCNFMESQKIEKETSREKIDKVQIIGVRDVRTALLLLSRYKFDMLFIDYLLDYKDERKREGEREYSIQFFKFLSNDYAKEAGIEKDKNKKNKYQLLERLRHTVLNNRGPLDKFWIMPITGFNSPFIQNLQNNYVPLISTRWHIEHGADPITTPWQFLVKLNQIIELQLKGCVYKKEQLITFLTYTGAELKRRITRNSKDKNPTCNFHDFQAFMGAEFSNFISHFGARPIIKRDAMIDEGDHHDKSVFSTYIWKEFYAREKTKDSKDDRKSLFALHNLMQFFYQAAASMPEDRNGVMRLREAFRRLRYYIEINGVDDVAYEEMKKADEEMKKAYKGKNKDEEKKKAYEEKKKAYEEKKKAYEEKKKELEETLTFIANCIDVLLEGRVEKV